jgi:hypothetical protein
MTPHVRPALNMGVFALAQHRHAKWRVRIRVDREQARDATPRAIGACNDAAGIAPASHIPQVASPHDTCVEQGCQWLHYVCTEEALQELVVAWRGLAPEVREKIVGLARSSQAC